MSNIKNKIITIILLTIICLTIGYISYSLTLTTEGYAKIANDWNVYFKDATYSITNINSESKAEATISNNRQTITLHPIFNNAEDEIVYDISIENGGLVDAYGNEEYIKWELKTDNPLISYEISPLEDIKKGDNIKFTVKFKVDGSLNEELNTIEEVLIGTLNYQQKK